jgi:hypothetical protein
MVLALQTPTMMAFVTTSMIALERLMPVAFATGRARFMNVDVPKFLRAIETAMETRSTC